MGSFWAAADTLEVPATVAYMDQNNTPRVVIDPTVTPDCGEWKAYGDSERIPRGAMRAGPYSTRAMAQTVADHMNARQRVKQIAMEALAGYMEGDRECSSQ